MACVGRATGGAGEYTIADFIEYNAAAASASIVLSTLLVPITLWLGLHQAKSLAAVPPSASTGAEMVRQWYAVINWFPSIAAVSCWLSIVMPNAGSMFQVVYECFEALALTRFSFIVLTLLNGGVPALDEYIASKGSVYNAALFPSLYVVLRDSSKTPWMLVSPPLSLFYPELRDDDDISRDVAAGGHYKPHHAGRLLLALYQFVILAPLCAFVEAVCVYAWKEVRG